MYRLYHYTLCPFSRLIRIMMAEKSIPFTPVLENYWERREVFLKMNKSGTVPFLAKKASDEELSVGIGHTLISGVNAIYEYLDEKFDLVPMIFGTPEKKAEIRRMVDWCNIKFYNEVVEPILHEKIINFFKYKSGPDQAIISYATQNLSYHIDYFGYLISSNGWIADKKMSLADIALAAHLSVLDYLGIINWSKMNDGNKADLKDWYGIMKSRPSLRSILHDSVPGFPAAQSYRELDF